MIAEMSGKIPLLGSLPESTTISRKKSLKRHKKVMNKLNLS
jgi:hypothetical protein